ncbi:hypothetical protein DFH09DRAFT_1108688 [Mycena vulgaris]|nr:hypothetical protein DFH09DRAFT_1108688 [Mycena vulgaris]
MDHHLKNVRIFGAIPRMALNDSLCNNPLPHLVPRLVEDDFRKWKKKRSTRRFKHSGRLNRTFLCLAEFEASPFSEGPACRAGAAQACSEPMIQHVLRMQRSATRGLPFSIALNSVAFYDIGGNLRDHMVPTECAPKPGGSRTRAREGGRYFQITCGPDVTEAELTGTSFPKLIEAVKKVTPNLWRVLMELARSPTQQKRSPKKDPSMFKGLSAKGFDTLHFYYLEEGRLSGVRCKKYPALRPRNTRTVLVHRPPGWCTVTHIAPVFDAVLSRRPDVLLHVVRAGLPWVHRCGVVLPLRVFEVPPMDDLALAHGQHVYLYFVAIASHAVLHEPADHVREADVEGLERVVLEGDTFTVYHAATSGQYTHACVYSPTRLRVRARPSVRALGCTFWGNDDSIVAIEPRTTKVRGAVSRRVRDPCRHSGWRAPMWRRLPRPIAGEPVLFRGGVLLSEQMDLAGGALYRGIVPSCLVTDFMKVKADSSMPKASADRAADVFTRRPCLACSTACREERGLRYLSHSPRRTACAYLKQAGRVAMAVEVRICDLQRVEAAAHPCCAGERCLVASARSHNRTSLLRQLVRVAGGPIGPHSCLYEVVECSWRSTLWRGRELRPRGGDGHCGEHRCRSQCLGDGDPRDCDCGVVARRQSGDGPAVLTTVEKMSEVVMILRVVGGRKERVWAQILPLGYSHGLEIVIEGHTVF